MSEREPSGFACESCGKDFSDHLGLVGTCDQLTAAQSRVEELEAENMRLRDLCESDRQRFCSLLTKQLTADNQRLRGLLRECLPIVRHSVDERFNVELPTYQNRLQLRDRIKAAIGDQ